MNEVLTRDVNGRRFDSGQVHHFHEIYNIIHHTTMRLTKYQKARLLEFEWNVVDNGVDNTCWLRIDKNDGRVFEDVKQLLDCSDGTDHIKILIVAHSGRAIDPVSH